MQHPQLSYFYDGTGSWVNTDNSKPNLFQGWESNGNPYLTGGNNYGQGQVPSGGGQTRVSVGPQQPPPPSQPTPTSTPPGLHGDIAKQPLQPATQMAIVQTRTMNPQIAYTRNPMPPQSQPMRTHGGGRPMNSQFHIGQMMPPQTPTIPVVHPVQAAPIFMYQQRQAGPFPNQAMYLQPSYYPQAANQPYYSHQVSQISQYQNLTSGGPSPQATSQQPPVTMLRPGLVSTTPQPLAVKQDKRQRNPIKIINPETNEEVDLQEGNGTNNNNNITPTCSNDSSARETPQPGAGGSIPLPDNTVAAEFAAKVAARAMDSETPAPDSVPLDSVSDSDAPHKQPPVVPISEIVSSTLNTASEEFVPRSFTMPSEVLVEQPRPSIVVPTVSADTDSPPVDIQRPPVVTKNPTMPSSLVTQSPSKTTTKKQKGNENERQQAAALPPPQQPQAEFKENKKGSKCVQREESVPLPKERREKPRTTLSEQSTIPATILAVEEVPNTPVEVTIPVAKEVKIQVVEEKDLDNKVQHQNGETVEHEPSPASMPSHANVAMPTESNKTSKRQSGKRSGKMKDLNRRGTEKEGSEMDAFTMEPTIMNEEKEKEAPPTPVRSPTPPPTIAEPVDKIQEDLEEKEDKLVAAKNEENNKVSALNRPEPEPSPVVEEKQPPQLTLRCSYSKDQWSPLNPEGKKKYDRQFLIDLRADPLCNQKPDKLPDVVVGMLKDISNNRNQNYNLRSDINLMPQFARNQSQRGLVPKRGSQQGNKKGSRVIQMSLSLNEEVKLKTTENAWKPTRLEGSAGKTENEKETEELLKNVRGILNKLTPQKFDKLMEKFMVLPITSEHRLNGVISLIFEKAVDEPSFSKAYAKMCKMCSKLEVTKIVDNNEEKVNFRKLLITMCQNEFEKNKAAELDAEKWHEDINSCTDPEKRKEKQLAYEEKERTMRMKSVGNIRFIGELFKLGMLTPAIMYRCIEHLLSNPAEESLECLCKLLTTIGKDLEFGNNPNKPQQAPPQFNNYFLKMAELSQKKGNSKVSSRVRFMLQDVIDLRGNKWVPRREDNNPKTIEQINKEAERESMEKAMALNQPAPRMNRQNERPDNRKRNQNDSDGWSTVPNRFHNNKFTNSAFESSKMQSVKDDLNTLTLGGSQAYRFPMGGKNAELKPSNSFTSSNVFSALQSKIDERKPPQSSMNNRRMTPTPSIERQRMLQTTKEGDGNNSRENSVQREKESSVSNQSPMESLTLTRRDDEKTPGQSENNQYKVKEKLEQHMQTLIEEYLLDASPVEDIRAEVEQLFTSDTCGSFILKALETVLEKKSPAQWNIGLLIAALLDSNIFSTQIVVQQFAIIYEVAEDYAIDIPKFWELQAQIIVPILASQKINFSHFRDACSTVLKSTTAAALLHPVLSLLVSKKGEGFVRNLWDSSNVSLKDFLPEEISVNDFVKEKSLHYLTGEYEVRLSMNQVQEQILRLIQNSQPYEKILDFITANVSDRVEDVSFIRALVTAFCEACITGPNNSELNESMFKQYEKLIERFVDHKEDRELACLNSVHSLCAKLQHPQGLILSIFSKFLDDNLICNESFLKWREDKHGLENKGVSVLSLASFFKALEEAETDDDNS